MHVSWAADTQQALDWQQQVEEVVALHSILGDSFELLSGLPVDALADEYPDPAELAAAGPADGELLECRLRVFVDVPAGYRLQVPSTAGQAPDNADIMAEADETGPRVSHLAPLYLRLCFPSDYPSAAPPIADLSAIWLTPESAQLLRDQLEGLWHEQGSGLPICYTWAEWLQTAALEALGHATSLPLKSIAAGLQTASISPPKTAADPAQTEADTDAVRVIADPGAGAGAWEKLLMQLLHADAVRDFQLFQEGTWTCGVCFEETLGRDCVRLECKHAFCTDCVTSSTRMHVAEGSVDRITCMEPGCSVALPRHVLERVLTAEEFERHEALTLQRTLDRMADLVYCPRCSQPVIEDSTHCAQCTRCRHVFCSLCNLAYHPGGTCLSPEAQLAILRQRNQGQRQNEEELRRREAEILNLATIKETAKQCPVCNMAIQRSEGCNKMTCANCGAFFCYRCNKRIQGYDHFGSGCVLFDPEEVARYNAMLAAQGEVMVMPNLDRGRHDAPEGRRFDAREMCPRCPRQNPKVERNNHIRCYGCGHSYCYLCRANLAQEGVRHFRNAKSQHRLPARCRQHTD